MGDGQGQTQRKAQCGACTRQRPRRDPRAEQLDLVDRKVEVRLEPAGHVPLSRRGVMRLIDAFDEAPISFGFDRDDSGAGSGRRRVAVCQRGAGSFRFA